MAKPGSMTRKSLEAGYWIVVLQSAVNVVPPM